MKKHETLPNGNGNNRRRRLVSRNRKERLRAIAIGKRHDWFSDMYARLLDVSWATLAIIIVLIYLSVNLAFTFFYLSIGNGIENAKPGSFADAFFFSVQTLATIGYGKMSPVGIMANTLVTVEAFFGFCFIAIVTGLLFTKFSRPTARLLFSNVAVIAPYNGVPHLMLRLANQRGNRIVDANARMTMLRTETSQEGQMMRRFYDLKLTRTMIPILQLTWTLMHPIDENSPLHNITSQKLEDEEVEIIVSIGGLDETLSQTVHARYSYVCDEIKCNERFVDILRLLDNGGVEINYALFHQTIPV
ncbi:MAG TPA: ion channel [Rickettsiales bacterium]|nr:ion channel [Rickettsiales bacterium]